MNQQRFITGQFLPCVHLEKLFGSTSVYSPQGPEMVLECSGLMIAREVIVKRREVIVKRL